MNLAPLAKLLVVGGACAPLAACSSTVRWPQLHGPGTAPAQRNAAEVIDPYALPDMGPEIVGGRPREFDKPRDEVRRSRQFLESVGARPPQMAPAMPVPVGTTVPLATPVPTGTTLPMGQPAVRY